MFYLFFEHFTEGKDAFLASSSKTFPMTKIPGFPAYVAAIQLSKDLKELTYQYQWNSHYCSSIKRPEIGELDIIFDTPESFGPSKTQSEKKNLFLQVLKFYFLHRGVVPL